MPLRLSLVLVLMSATHAFAQIDPAQELLRFSERGPKSKAISGADYELSQETFHAYYPKRWDPKHAKRYGLFVWMSPAEYGVIPPMWKKLLDKKKLIAIGPDKAGNLRPAAIRQGLALDAAFNMLLRHPDLDPRRIYVGGFSGGGNMSCFLAFAHPGLFRGAIYIGGSLYHRDVPVPDQPGRVWRGGIPDPGPELMKLVKERTVHVHLVGIGDTYALPQARAVFGLMQEDGFQRAHLLEINKLGHELPKARDLEQAIKLLDSKPKKPKPE